MNQPTPVQCSICSNNIPASPLPPARSRGRATAFQRSQLGSSAASAGAEGSTGGRARQASKTAAGMISESPTSRPTGCAPNASAAPIPITEQSEAQREQARPAAAALDLPPEQELRRPAQAAEVDGLEQRAEPEAEREGGRRQPPAGGDRARAERQVRALDRIDRSTASSLAGSARRRLPSCRPSKRRTTKAVNPSAMPSSSSQGELPKRESRPVSDPGADQEREHRLERTLVGGSFATRGQPLLVAPVRHGRPSRNAARILANGRASLNARGPPGAGPARPPRGSPRYLGGGGRARRSRTRTGTAPGRRRPRAWRRRRA